MKKTFLLLLCAFALSLTACAEKCNVARELTSREEIDANPQVVVPTMTVYNGDLYPNVAPAAPKGFKPIFMVGYFRHGSRLEALESYPIETHDYFVQADKAGLLTPLGKEVMKYMKWNLDVHENRTGDITTTGFNQHKQLGKRYCKNFPMLFKGAAQVGSVGSTSLRATMSMVAFNEGMKEYNPQLNNTMEASEVVTVMIRPQKSAHNKLYTPAEEAEYKSFLKKEVFSKLIAWGNRQNLDHAKNALFTDPSKFFSLFEEEPFKIMSNIYKRLAFSQNMGINDRTLIDQVFTADECHIMYKVENARWYYRCATAAHPILANNMSQSRLTVDYMANQIDEAIAGKDNETANFIFGHDLNIIPLQAIFGLDHLPIRFEKENENIDYIAERWRGYKITPMAANFMFIIYRNKAGEVLVRAQINERDVELPVETNTPYYYDWNEVKKLAYSRLDEIDQLKKAN